VTNRHSIVDIVLTSGVDIPGHPRAQQQGRLRLPAAVHPPLCTARSCQPVLATESFEWSRLVHPRDRPTPMRRCDQLDRAATALGDPDEAVRAVRLVLAL